MPEIILTDRFKKKAIRFLKQHAEIVSQYKKTLLQLQIDPFHSSLRLHKLKGKLKEVYYVSINMKYRILMEFIIQDDQIIPINIGSHNGVYVTNE